MSYKDLQPQEFQSKVSADEKGVLLDVRTPEEVAEGFIPGKMHIDVQGPDFAQLVGELDKSMNYYVYCRSGGRSAAACQFMRSLEFTGEVFNLEGGITAWPGAIETP